MSFPSLATKLDAPARLVEGNTCRAENCSVPRVGDFFLDGARDTAIYAGTYLAFKHVITPYVIPTVARVVSRPVNYLKRPFVEWYNKALYAADGMTARSFEAGAAAAQENIALSSIAALIAEEVPAYSVSAPVLTDITVSETSASIYGSVNSFKSPVGSGSLTSLSSAIAPNIISSSREAGTAGLLKVGNRIKYASAPALPNLGRGTSALRSMSMATSDSLVVVPVQAYVRGGTVSLDIVKSNGRSVLSTILRGLARVPKKRRRQANIVSRKLATSMRATGKGLGAVGRFFVKIPSWVGHSVGLALPWVFSGVTNLKTFDVRIDIIHPVQNLGHFERYFIAITTLLMAQCFHDKQIRNLVNS